MYFCYFVIFSPWKMVGPLIWTDLSPYYPRIHWFFIWTNFTQGCFVPSLVEIGLVVLEKKILKMRQCIFAISLLSPLGKEQRPSFEQTWIPYIQGCIESSLVEIGPVVLQKKNFLISSMYFRYFELSPLGKGRALHLNKLNPLHTRMLCAKFVWNMASGSEEEDFLISSMYFRYFIMMSSWKRAGPFIWKTWIPFTQECFVPSLVEIGQVVMEKKIV